MLACSAAAAPHLARGLIENGRFKATGMEIATIADRLRSGKADAEACRGVKGFTEEDWKKLDKLVEEAAKTPEPDDPNDPEEP
jgi:hypothetical protein